MLVCTDCLTEGINLQEHFDAVVHYDLAWNPTRHEQREGRVDRYGQPSPTVRVAHLLRHRQPDRRHRARRAAAQAQGDPQLARHLRAGAGRHRRGRRGDPRGAAPARRSRRRASSCSLFEATRRAERDASCSTRVGGGRRPREALAHHVRPGDDQAPTRSRRELEAVRARDRRRRRRRAGSPPTRSRLRRAVVASDDGDGPTSTSPRRPRALREAIGDRRPRSGPVRAAGRRRRRSTSPHPPGRRGARRVRPGHGARPARGGRRAPRCGVIRTGRSSAARRCCCCGFRFHIVDRRGDAGAAAARRGLPARSPSPVARRAPSGSTTERPRRCSTAAPDAQRRAGPGAPTSSGASSTASTGTRAAPRPSRASARASELLDAHRRVRAGRPRRTGVSYAVEPQLPAGRARRLRLPAAGRRRPRCEPAAATCSRPSAPRARSCRADLLQRVADGDREPRRPDARADYHLAGASGSTRRSTAPGTGCSAPGRAFRDGSRKRSRPATAGTPLTRERWLLPLFQELGYGRLPPRQADRDRRQDLPDLARLEHTSRSTWSASASTSTAARPASRAPPGQPAQPGAGAPQPLRRAPLGLRRPTGCGCASCATTSASPGRRTSSSTSRR